MKCARDQVKAGRYTYAHMSGEYTEELAFVSTEDSLDLEGAIIRPAATHSRAAIVWIHGSTYKFSDRPYVELGREIARRGCTFISGNTRGHDLAALFAMGEG